jgi:CRP-like cAMP-binding protein
VLQGLDAAAGAAIGPHLERTALAAGEVLEEKGKPAAHIYFPTSAVVALHAGAGKQSLQVALVGREGMVGMSLLLDSVAANRAVVQFAGATLRVPAGALDACLETSRPLHRQMLRGVNAFIAHLSQTALANGQGTIEQRLARWLLTAAERLDADQVAITHETLSEALGVRRSGVTVALHVLEGKKTLQSERGRVRLLDRDKLSAVAGDFQPR